MENAFLKKLQIKAGFQVNIINPPENIAAIFENIPEAVSLNYDDDNTSDAVIIFSTNNAHLNHQIEKQVKLFSVHTVFWIFYPKKSSKIESDLDLMNSWRSLSVYGLSPCASASVNEIWTGLRLKLASEIKKSGLGNEEIKMSDYGNYIDPVNKTVVVPEDLALILHQNPVALNFFSTLAYSHKKEYVLWILTAKQEKTRLNRIEKALQMLLSGKKNPSAK